uniref:Uncharacterized protein n=1 Tax=Daphnia magna TaxID=35525 RepID=A0A0P6JJ93_9CRUS
MTSIQFCNQNNNKMKNRSIFQSFRCPAVDRLVELLGTTVTHVPHNTHLSVCFVVGSGSRWRDCRA